MRCYSAVDAKPKRTRNLRRLSNIAENPHVSLVVDRWDEDWSQLCWVIVEGRAEVLTERCPSSRAPSTCWSPSIRSTATLPLDRADGAVVAITPDRVLAWRPA